MSSIFYINDPSNQSATLPMLGFLAPEKGGRFPQKHDQRWRFNELEQRKQHLCGLLKNPCVFGTTIDVLGHLFFMPFPIHSH